MRALVQKRSLAPERSSSGLSRTRAATPQQTRRADTAPPTTLFGHDLSRIPLHSGARTPVQPKLTAGGGDNAYEREADRTAERVMSTRANVRESACACGGGCPACEGSRVGERLQTKSVRAGDAGVAGAPHEVREALRSPGRGLDPEARAFMESRFGHDFGRVRVHAGAGAAQAASSLRARAFTVGRDIVFGAGEYAPATDGGRRLLAHELTHVLQQGGGATPAAHSPVVQRAADGVEGGSALPAEPAEPAQLGSVELDINGRMGNDSETTRFRIPVTRSHVLVTFRGVAVTNTGPQTCRTVRLYLYNGSTFIGSHTFPLDGTQNTQDYTGVTIDPGMYNFKFFLDGDYCAVNSPSISVRW